MNDIIARLYGGAVQNPISNTVSNIYGGGSFPQAQTPDWSAGASGDAVGGIGNTAAMGEDINWSTPDRSDTNVGQVVSTPAGKYKVVETADGFALEPMEGALRGVSPTLNNFTAGEHHLGINPQTGEVWYQKAQGIPSQFSQTEAAQQVQQPPAQEETPTGPKDLTSTASAQRSSVSGMPSSAFTASPLQGLNISSAAAPALIQQRQPSNADYVQMLNQMMINSLFKDMI